MRELSGLLQTLAENTERKLDADELRLTEAAAEAFPYWPLPLLVLLRCDGRQDDAGRNELRHRLSLLCADRRTLAYAAHGPEWANFYPPEAPPAPKETEDVIDLFLQTYGNSSPEENALLEKMIFNPTPDYAEILAREEQSNLPEADEAADPESQDARINAFIRSQHPASPLPETEKKEAPAPETRPAPIPKPEHTDDTLLSESLAKIFIKQGRYERAYEIISGLNLKFPKKSAYFADQLRFLQKLIINQRRIDSKKSDSHQ